MHNSDLNPEREFAMHNPTHSEVPVYTCKPIRSEVKYQYQPGSQTIQQPQKIANLKTNRRQPLKLNPELLKNPTSPTLVYQDGEETCAMPVMQMRLILECNVATIFGKLQLNFVNNSRSKVNAVLIVPTDATISSVHCVLGERSQRRYLESTYITSDEAGRVASKQTNAPEGINIEYTPGIFRLPLKEIKKKEQVQVEIEFIQSLPYIEGRSTFTFPTAFDPELLPENIDLQYFMDIQIKIAGKLLKDMTYGSNSHELFMVQSGGPGTDMTLQCVPIAGSNNRVFHFSYYIKTNLLDAMMLVDNGDEGETSFTLTINPPIVSEGRFPRDIVFLVDRSGSMGGQPYQSLIKGLEYALLSLGTRDRFDVICFDHEIVQCFGDLTSPGEDKREQALNFCQKNLPRGLTDIKKPLLRAFWLLNGPKSNERSMKFVILLTDGCVEKEREICREAQENCGQIRLLTFGIGRYCNQLFLNMLSSLCHGWTSGAVYVREIEEKMRQFLMQCSTPILNNISLYFFNAKAEIYPETIPDLYLGKPVQISGKFLQAVPDQVILRGTWWNGTAFELYLKTERSSYPVRRIAVTQRIDELQAKHWLTEDPKVKKEIIATSQKEQVPSMYTNMVSYELSEKEKKKEDKNEKKNSGKSSGAAIMALAGGAIVVGTAAYFAGDIAASLANTDPGLLELGAGNVGDLFNNIPDCPCDGIMSLLSCGTADCGQLGNVVSCGALENCSGIMECLEPIQACCAPCGVCLGPIDGCFDSLGSALGLAFSGLADCELDACVNCCGDSALEMQDCLIECCGPVASTLSGGLLSIDCADLNCIALISSCMESCSNLGGDLAESCSSLFGCCGEVVDAVSQVVDEVAL